MDVGDGRAILQEFQVIESSEATVILGRDFLRRFQSTEFDWVNHKVRLGSKWWSTEASVRGGGPLTRAGIVSVLDDPFNSYSSKNWDINAKLAVHEREALGKLLFEYQDIFAIDPKKPSVTHLAEHSIVTGAARPVKAKGIRVSPQAEQSISTQVRQMLRNGIIRPSNSPWCSRVILVEKKDGTMMFAVDYRSLNNETKRDYYPLPEIRDILDKLHGSNYYSSLDGASAYWSIPVAEQDREKTAFITPRGQYEFVVMPFGLTNSPSTYQRAIDTTLRSATNSLPYVDDTLVHSSPMTAHLQDLRSTLECYRRASMQLRRDKCRFGYSEIEFVGHVITEEGHRPLPRLIVKIKIQERSSSP